MPNCYDCGEAYNRSDRVDYDIPNELWAEIRPAKEPEGGILCFSCVGIRLSNLGYGTTKPPIEVKLFYHGMNGRSMVQEGEYTDWKSDNIPQKSCKHTGYVFKQHGRCCSFCGMLLTDGGGLT